MQGAGCTEPEEALLDRTVFNVISETYAAFVARLDEPPKPNDRLRHTMQSVPPRGVVVPVSRPEPLADIHKLNDFFSGFDSLNDWLKRRVRPNQMSGPSRTFVIAENQKVAGCYAQASGAIIAADTVGRLRRNMPDPIPIAILGRLAIDHTKQGQGLGRALFRDCALRVAHAADTIGIRGIGVHSPGRGRGLQRTHRQQALEINVYSHRALEQLLRGFNTACNERLIAEAAKDVS